MQNTFFRSNFSRRCNSLSFSFNDDTYCSNDRFCRHHFLHASQLPVYSPPLSSLVSCSACCSNVNLSIYNVHVAPIFLCGLWKSSLIQYTPCTRVIFNGLDRVISRLPYWSVSNRYSFEEVWNFKEKCVCRSRNGLGKRRYSCVVYEDSDDEYGVGYSSDDEAEVMFSLLTDEVSEKCLDVWSRGERRHKKVIVEERDWENGAYQCETCGSKKVGSRRFVNESAVNRTRDEVEALLRREHQRVCARREDKERLLRGRLRKDENDDLQRESRKKEREDSLIENHAQSARSEHGENLLRREGHRQRLRNDGLSCSSHYSLSSMGEYQSNSRIQERRDEFEEGLTGKYKRDSVRLEEIEFDGKAESHEGYQDEQRLVLKKGKRVEGDELNFHKESEKKLTDMSTDETRFHIESDVQDDVSRKALNKYEGQEEKATSIVKSNKGRIERRRTKHDELVQKTEAIKNYKQFKEHSEGYRANLTSSSDSQTLHSQREGISTTGSNSLKETRNDHYNKAGLITSEEESSKHAQSSKYQKLDISKTSCSGIKSKTTQKDQEKDSHTVLSSVHDAKEKHYHEDRFSTQIDSRKTSQQLTEELEIQRATSSQKHSKHNIKQEESSSLVYDSYHESIKNIQTNEEVGKSESMTSIEKKTNTSLGNSRGSGRNDADQWSGRMYDIVVKDPSFQIVAKGGASHAGATSGLTIEEVGHDSSHEYSELGSSGGSRVDETYGQPLGYISHEDARASADLLQKSSSYHVGEFMEKVRHEISSSELYKEKRTNEIEMEHDSKQYEQHAVTEVASGSSLLKELGPKSRHPCSAEGPFGEMWDVDELPNLEHNGAELLDRSRAGSVITKRDGRYLWNVVSDVVRFPWALRPTNQSQMSKLGEKSLPNQSTRSEAWFSGNEPDENIQESDTNRKGSISQESISLKIPKEEKVQPRSQGESSDPLSSKDQIQPKSLSYAEISSWNTSLGEGTSYQQSEGIVSGASMEGGSSKSPAMHLRRSPYIIRENFTSGGGEIVQTKLPVPPAVSEISQPEGKGGEQKPRKFLRTTQVVKDRYEEWEESCRIEAEQKKTDEMFMREALLEARKAADSWEVPVGAVLVHDGKIIARGHNLVEELRDSTAHAEIICIREASNIFRTWRLSETTLYVTLEPCAMCAGAILQARIDAIVWGAPNKLIGADGSWIRLFPNGEGDDNMNPSDKAAAPVHPFHPNIQIRRNVLESECADAMQPFFQRRRKKENKQEPRPSRLPIVNRSSKLLAKMHGAFHMTFFL